MLDVKLANYSPFVELMAAAGGGMFVTASDDIEAMQIDRYQIKENIILFCDMSISPNYPHLSFFYSDN